MRGHDDVDQDDDQREERQQVAESIALILDRTADFEVDAVGQRIIGDQLLDFGHHVAQRHAGTQGRLHGNDTLAVLALDFGRGILLLHLADLLELDGPTLHVVERDVLDILDPRAERLAIADDDVVLVAVLTIFRSRQTIDAVAHGLCRRNTVHAVVGQTVAIEDDIVFGAQVVARKLHVARTLQSAEPLLQVIGDGVRDVHIVTEDLDVGRGRTAHAARHAARSDGILTHLGNAVQFGTQQVGNLVDRTLAQADIGKAHVVVDDVRTGGLHRRKGVVRGVGAGRSRDDDHLGELRVDDAVDLPRDPGSILHREVLLQLDDGRNTAVVRRREKLGRHLRDESQ